MHGRKILRVPLEMQTSFPYSLCYPWPSHANTSANHLLSSMKCKQRWRTSCDIPCHNVHANAVLSKFRWANGTQAMLLPVTQDGNLCHLVQARIHAVLNCGSSKLPLPTCKVVVGSWQDDSDKTFPQEHCLPSDLRKGSIGSGLDLRKQKRKNAWHTKRIIPQGCKCNVAHTSTAISVPGSSYLSERCRLIYIRRQQGAWCTWQQIPDLNVNTCKDNNCNDLNQNLILLKPTLILNTDLSTIIEQQRVLKRKWRNFVSVRVSF